MNLKHNALRIPTTLREKLAQLMFVRIGSNLPPVRKVEQDEQRIRELLNECPVGGLIVFNGHRDETPATLERLQATSRYPLLVSADIERGVGQQLHGLELFPHAMAFDALGDEAEGAVEEFARLTAVEARACGLHITFAPVADINIDPRNPIIATRAFRNDPTRVSQLVRAFVRGCKAGGLSSTAKHFPGHGNTHEDSHHELPTVDSDRESMRHCDLIPFRAAISAGVELIMSAHIQYTAWDKSDTPATLSRPILHDLLRDELGFPGALVSDSLLMDGVRSQYSNEGELAVRAVLAGVDILLDVAEPQSTLSALEAAVDSGALPIERVEESFARVWQLKQRMFEQEPPEPDDHIAANTARLANRVAAGAIREFSSDVRFAPFDPNEELCVVLVRPYESRLDPPQQPLGQAVAELSPNCEYYEFGPKGTAEDFRRALKAAEKAKQVLAAIIVKPAAWHAFGLLPEQCTFVEQLIEQQNCVIASLGSPEALDQFENATAKLCAYSDVPASQRALAKFIFRGGG